VCTTQTASLIGPGFCVDVDCTWAAGDGEVRIVVDDDSTGEGANTECREENNRLDVTISCP
jgi:hypothetical protein